MQQFTVKQRKQLAKNIRLFKRKTFPDRGGGKQLAALMGVSPQLVSNWLSGIRAPSLIQLAKLARIFGVSIQELCSLPYSNRKSSAPELVIKLTKYRTKAGDSVTTTQKERNRLHAINIMINKELKDIL